MKAQDIKKGNTWSYRGGRPGWIALADAYELNERILIEVQYATGEKSYRVHLLDADVKMDESRNMETVNAIANLSLSPKKARKAAKPPRVVKAPLRWVKRNEDKPHRCPECHAIAFWDKEHAGPRTIIRCPNECEVQWRFGIRMKRMSMRWKSYLDSLNGTGYCE